MHPACVQAIKKDDQPRKRCKPGVKALREIRKEQRSTELSIPRTRFNLVVKQVSEGFKSNIRWTKQAKHALHVAVEDYIVKLLEATNLTCIHAKRVTIDPKDMKHVERILKIFNAGNEKIGKDKPMPVAY